jgi:hypothetical protein
LAASGQRRPDAAGQILAINDTIPESLCRLIEAWPKLPPHIQSAILALLDAAGVD